MASVKHIALINPINHIPSLNTSGLQEIKWVPICVTEQPFFPLFITKFLIVWELSSCVLLFTLHSYAGVFVQNCAPASRRLKNIAKFQIMESCKY